MHKLSSDAVFNRRVLKTCALSGLGSMVVAFGSQVVLLPWGQQGWVYDFPSMGDSPSAIARFWADNQDAAAVGSAGFELAWAILIFWSVLFSWMLWRLHDGIGSRLIAAGTACAAMTIPFLMMVVTAFWTVAGYRAHDADPGITRAMSDLGYIGSFIWFWTALITMSFSGWLMLRYRHSPYAFPVWVGKLSVAAGLTQLPAIAVTFVYGGIWSLNGLLGWYIPLAGWVVWMAVVSPVMYAMVTRESAVAELAIPEPATTRA